MKLGVVVIGRNEGQRLRRCLASLDSSLATVYVDSGSTDGSSELAHTQGFLVHPLDPERSFSAGRARNEGFDFLLHDHPDLDAIFFLDGDCELIPGWLEAAKEALRKDSKLALVCGRRKEMFPDASRWNRLVHAEWNTPIGEATACGGDFVVRVPAFRAIGGFDLKIPAGEEPELCFRLRAQGDRILRLGVDMTCHDADLHAFRPWWIRMRRTGQAALQGCLLHGRSPERFRLRETLRPWFWIVGLTAIAIAATCTYGNWGLLLFFGWPLLILKVTMGLRQRNHSWKQALEGGFFNFLGKWAELSGQIRLLGRMIQGKRAKLVEYKQNEGGVA